jgi:hypothetical protein
MRIIRGRADARWLPSRHNFALFRLAAYLRCRTAKPEPAETILVIDRNQSAFETYAVSVWLLLTLTGYLAATLFGSWPVVTGVAAAFPVAVAVSHAPFFILAPFLAPLDGAKTLRVQSAALLLLYVAAAVWFATRASWVRVVAWQFLGIAALNAIAAAIVFLLRHRIAQLEDAFGGSPSAP